MSFIFISLPPGYCQICIFVLAELADGFYLGAKCAFRHKVLFSLRDAMCIPKMVSYHLHILSINIDTGEVFVI